MTKKAYYRAYILFVVIPAMACLIAAAWGYHWRLMIIVSIFWIVDIALVIESYKRLK